jgi:uroporphyrinogen III methyltransferase/synthase
VVNKAQANKAQAGKVHLVGAGPGDPGLITQKGLLCLGKAQVVVYDRLLDPSLLEAAPESAERIFVGKGRGNQALTQEEINQVLINRAEAGLNVVRLKGGDPFVFGRGGEEALALAERGLSFEIVPGVTSAVAAAAYAGIPVTHRGIASSFTVVSGSEDPTKPESTIEWQAMGESLSRTGGTLEVLMGWNSLEPILEALVRGGLASTTPVALVQWGTWPHQNTVTGNLENIIKRGREAGLEPPVMAIIGGVVELREKLRWFDRRPLFGKKVLVTRSRTQASRLKVLLGDMGAQPVELPTIQTTPLEDYGPLDSALARLSQFGWAIFASVNAVDAVFARLELSENFRDARAFGGVRIGAIGPATAAALESRGIFADFIPATSVSEAVVQQLASLDWSGRKVLLPGADIGRDVLANGLKKMGAKVELVSAYRTVAPEGVSDLTRRVIGEGVDVVTFTSSSTARNLMDALDGDSEALNSSLIACIGPTTAATAKELGLNVGLVAKEHNVEGLVEALTGYFRK